MGQLVRVYCPAYSALEAAARERAPRAPVLHVAEIVQILERHRDTATAFREISDDLDTLKQFHDPESIAKRLDMPVGFVAALLIAIRDGGNALVRVETVPYERIGAPVT